MSDIQDNTLQYIENLLDSEPQVRHFLVCTTSNIPVWSKIYHWFLKRYQCATPIYSHCLVATLDVDNNKLHMFECDWYTGVSYCILCPTPYLVPRDVPGTYTICIEDSDVALFAIDCTDVASGATLHDMTEQFNLAHKLNVKKMTPLTLLSVYFQRPLSRFVCTSFAQFMLEPCFIHYRYPMTVDQLVASYLA